MNNRIAIIGHGHVGQGMNKLFPDALVVDPGKGLGSMAATRGCALALVCVPTPQLSTGGCDTRIVERVVGDCLADRILVKSTVTPGTCDRLRRSSGKRIAFSPEYMGEGKYWTPPQFPAPTDPISHGFCILGGAPSDCSEIADLMLPVLGPATRFRFMSALEAELVKYFENAFFALKVSFANEIREICEAAGANYHVVREGWLDDPRVGPMHTAAFKGAPGFDGKCLPKDLAALVDYCKTIRRPSLLLEAVLSSNLKRRNRQE